MEGQPCKELQSDLPCLSTRGWNRNCQITGSVELSRMRNRMISTCHTRLDASCSKNNFMPCTTLLNTDNLPQKRDNTCECPLLISITRLSYCTSADILVYKPFRKLFRYVLFPHRRAHCQFIMVQTTTWTCECICLLTHSTYHLMIVHFSLNATHIPMVLSI